MTGPALERKAHAEIRQGQVALRVLAGSMPDVRPGRRLPSEFSLDPEETRARHTREISREKLRERALHGLFASGLRLTVDGNSTQARTPVVDVANTNGIGAEIERRSTAVLSAEKGPLTETTITFRRHFPPTENHPRGFTRKVLEITGDIERDADPSMLTTADVSRLRLNGPMLRMGENMDYGTGFDARLIRAGRDLAVVEATGTGEIEIVQHGIHDADKAELLSERERDFGLLDRHLYAITYARPNLAGENVHLRAFREWSEREEADALLRLYNARVPAPTEGPEIQAFYDYTAQDRLDLARKQVENTVRTGSPTRTKSPHTYLEEQDYLTQSAAILTENAFEGALLDTFPNLGLSQAMHTAGNGGSVESSVDPEILMATAKLSVIRDLRERQAKIEAGTLVVKDPPTTVIYPDMVTGEDLGQPYH
jgi:hypothetical protein